MRFGMAQIGNAAIGHRKAIDIRAGVEVIDIRRHFATAFVVETTQRHRKIERAVVIHKRATLDDIFIERQFKFRGFGRFRRLCDIVVGLSVAQYHNIHQWFIEIDRIDFIRLAAIPDAPKIERQIKPIGVQKFGTLKSARPGDIKPL